MGVMAGLFALMNLIADSLGPGAPGFPQTLHQLNQSLPLADPGKGDFKFLLESSLATSMLILVHVMWTVLLWDSFHECAMGGRRWWLGTVYVVVVHFAFTSVVRFVHSNCSIIIYLFTQSFINHLSPHRASRNAVSLTVQSIVLLSSMLYAYVAAGGTWCRFVATIIHYNQPKVTTSDVQQQGVVVRFKILTYIGRLLERYLF